MIVKEVNKIASLQDQILRIHAKIQKQVNDSLQKEVASHVKDKISNHVQSDVYSAYPNPIEYTRRNLQNGSLGDIKQMESNLINDGVLEVKDNADFNHDFASIHGGYGDIDLSKSLAYNIEYGYGSMSQPWNEPRDFINETKKDIKSSNSHVEVLKGALRKRLGSDIIK